MSKFKIKVKLTGFELEIEGDRQDIPALTRSVSKQLGSMVSPPSSDMFEEAEVVSSSPQAALPEASKPTPKKRKSSSSKVKSGAASKKDITTIIELDARSIESKYGSPRQKWTANDKLLWLLHILDKEHQLKSATSLQLKETFNRYFRSVGEVTAQNVADLRKKILVTPSLVGKDTGVDPATWYLKDAGTAYVEALITGKDNA